MFEADIVVPRLELQRHRFVLAPDAMAKLIADITPHALDVSITLDDLQGLIRKDGELMNVLKLKGDDTTREYILKTLAAHAWLNDVPWTITQSSDEGLDDPRFGKFVRAYMESDKSKELRGDEPCR